MMARFPAPMAGWSASCRRWSTPSSRRSRRRCRTACRPGITALLGGAVVFFGVHPKTKRRFVVQSIEGGGWGGRPFEDGESGTVSVCQGDVRNGSIEGIELKCPVLVESRALRTDSGGAGKYRGGLGIDMRVRNLVEGQLEFRARRGAASARPGASGAASPASTASYLLRQPGENEFHARWPAPTSRCRSTPRRSCAPAAAAAGAIRSSAIAQRWSQRCRGGLHLARRGARAYGVVLRGNMSLDGRATARLRKRCGQNAEKSRQRSRLGAHTMRRRLRLSLYA